MTVKEILIEKLKALGADGLCCEGCGCGLDDLMPCVSNCDSCEPARKTIATEETWCTEIGDEIYTPLEVKE